MNKRQKATEEKRQQEIAAIECELRLIAMGASGSWNVEDDPENGCGLFNTLRCESWARFISAVESYWQMHKENDEGLSNRHVVRPHNLHRFEYLATAAEFLYNNGARAGGEWL